MTTTVQDMVDREVIHCVTELVDGLQRSLIDREYAQELLDLAQKPGSDDPICEYWIVSEWLGDKLQAKGECVVKDFLGLNFWGRTIGGGRPGIRRCASGDPQRAECQVMRLWGLVCGGGCSTVC